MGFPPFRAHPLVHIHIRVSTCLSPLSFGRVLFFFSESDAVARASPEYAIVFFVRACVARISLVGYALRPLPSLSVVPLECIVFTLPLPLPLLRRVSTVLCVCVICSRTHVIPMVNILRRPGAEGAHRAPAFTRKRSGGAVPAGTGTASRSGSAEGGVGGGDRATKRKRQRSVSVSVYVLSEGNKSRSKIKGERLRTKRDQRDNKKGTKQGRRG